VALNPDPQFTRFVMRSEGAGRGDTLPPEGPHLTQVMTSPADRGAPAVAGTSECHGALQYYTQATEGARGSSTVAYSTMSEFADVSAWGTANVTGLMCRTPHF